MEYRGKQIIITQDIKPNSWKWAARLDETTVKRGLAKTRAAAMTSAVMAIDQALKVKKVRLIPPAE